MFYIALGLWVASIRPRRRVNLAYAIYAVLFGVVFVVRNALGVSPVTPDTEAMVAWTEVALIVSEVALLAIVLLYPVPLRRANWRMLALPVGLSAADLAANAYVGFQYPLGPLYTPLSLATGMVGWAVFGLLAQRFVAASGPGATMQRRQYALLMAAIYLFIGYRFGTGLGTPGASPTSGTLISIAFVLILSAMWLAATRVGPPDARLARNVGLLMLFVPLMALVFAVAVGGAAAADNTGARGIVRSSSVVIIAYAILRHQLLGVDVKVKFAINRGTLAAVFLATFLVVSQLVQNVTGSQFGPFVGAIAAGLLLFALSPLQRFAERVADTAMPGVKALGELNAEDRQRVYSDMVASAWADGVITRDERRMLGELRAKLGLPHDVAERIEMEAARAAPALEA